MSVTKKHIIWVINIEIKMKKKKILMPINKQSLPLLPKKNIKKFN